MAKKEEDSLNILIGFILIVFVALALIWAFSGISSCPEGTFSCDASISSCGCCVDDAYGNPVESCDYDVCPEGTYYFEGKGCCSTSDPASCLKDYKYCKNLIECGESYCCGSDVCQILDNGSSNCIPCSVTSICNPENVNSCCDGFACGSDGFCKKLDSCIGLPCTNYGGACQICSNTDGSNCLSCEDNSVCVYNSILNSGVCTSVTCKGNSCNYLGQQCSFSPTVPCTEICVNYNGINTCLPVTGCPDGTYPCNLEGCSGCCDIYTGACASCLNNPCSEEQEGQLCSLCDTSGVCISCPESVCKSGLCVPVNGLECESPLILIDGKCINPNVPPEDPGPFFCEPGYFYSDTLKKCVSKQPVKCDTPLCTFENEGEHCIEIVDETHVKLCTSLCSPQIEGGYSCTIPSDEDEDINPNNVPDWLIDLKSSCVEVCEDCPVCETKVETYDLNKDGYLNVFDYEIFMNFYNSITIPHLVENGNEFDFNYDNVINENDEKCILGICSGDCRIIGVDELGVCVTADYFNNSLTIEQRGVYPDYELMFKNIEKIPNVFDCSDVNTIDKPYCEEFKKELENSEGNILSMRDLSYVISEKNQLGLFYSSCSYIKDNIFAMYTKSNSCTGIMDVYFSKDLLYKSITYGMGVFNNCLLKAPDKNVVKGTFGEGANTIVNPTFEGSCSEYKNHIMQTCINPTGEGSITMEVCENNCKDFNDWEKLNNVLNYLDDLNENNDPIITKCAYPFGCGNTGCDSYCETVSYALVYGSCKICDQCDSISTATTNWCSDKSISISIPDRIDSYNTNYKSYYDTCIGLYGITSSNCILYAECMKEFDHKFCYDLAIKSFWVKDGTTFSKELYCYLTTNNYDTLMINKYIKISESIIASNVLSKTSLPIEPVFAGFMDYCPAGVLCEFAPSYCFKTEFGWEYTGGITWDDDEGPDFVFGGDIDLTKFTTNTKFGIAGSTSKTGPGTAVKMQQDILTEMGIGSVINVEGDYGGGGYQQNYGG